MVRTVPVRTAVAAGGVVVLVAACGASAADDKHPDHRSFALHGRTLTVDSDNSALEIVATDSARTGTVEVTRWFQGSAIIGSDPRATWSMKDDRLVLRLKCSGIMVDCSAKHRVEVPRGIVVTVADGNGSVRAHGFKDALDISAHNGSVHVTDSTGPLELGTTNGSVRAEVSSPKVGATSHNGSVAIGLPRATYRVRTGTANGSVEVSVPRDDASAHAITARSHNGKITVRTAN